MYLKVLERNTISAVSILIYSILKIVSSNPIDEKYAMQERKEIIMNQKHQDSFDRTLGNNLTIMVKKLIYCK